MRQPEDGSPLAYWKIRRLIRNVVWLIGGLTIAWLLALALSQSRENAQLNKQNAVQLTEIKGQREQLRADVASLLAIVKQSAEEAKARGEAPPVTIEQAVDALKKAGFPQEIIDEAVQQSAAGTTTTTTRRPTSTTTTTTTARAGPPGPPGPPGPQGPPGATGSPGKSETPTTTTTRRSLVCVNLLGIRVAC